MHYARATLFPFARTVNAQKLLADAVLSSVVQKRAVRELERQLSELDTAKVSMHDLQSGAFAILGGNVLDESARAQNGVLERHIFETTLGDLAAGRPELPHVRTLWQELQAKHKHRSRTPKVNHALDSMSVMSRLSLFELHSHWWEQALQSLYRQGLVTQEFYAFHMIWQCLGRIEGEEPGTEGDLFACHIPGLHPAGSMLLRTSRGAQAIADVIIEQNASARDRWLHALYQAVLVYETFRTERRDSVKATAVANRHRNELRRSKSGRSRRRS